MQILQQPLRQLALGGLVITLFVAGPALAFQSDEARSERETALALLRNRQFGRAIEAFERAIATDPDYETAYLELADVFIATALPGEADRILSQARVRFPDSSSPNYNLLYFDLAELWVRSGRLKEARETMERAARFEGPVGPAIVFRRLGDFDTDLLRLDEALVAYRRAQAASPEDLGIRLALGNLYLRRDDLEEAAGAFSEVIRADPTIAGAHHGMSEVYWRRGQLEEAVAEARRVLAIDPEHRGATYILGSALVRLGRDGEGRQVLDEYRALQAMWDAGQHRQREIQALRSAGVALVLEGRYPEAVALLEGAIETWPDASELYLSLGQAQSEMGRHREAIGTFETWLALRLPDSVTAHQYLAREYGALGDVASSERHQALYEAGLSGSSR